MRLSKVFSWLERKVWNLRPPNSLSPRKLELRSSYIRRHAWWVLKHDLRWNIAGLLRGIATFFERIEESREVTPEFFDPEKHDVR